MKQTGIEMKIKHSCTEVTDGREPLTTASERCAVQCSQHDALSCSTQRFANLRMSVLT